MSVRCSYVPYRQTGKFQPIVCDYLDHDPFLNPFYEAAPTLENMAEFIRRKRESAINREVLVSVLQDQYTAAGILSTDIQHRIDLLNSAETFTVTTGQQTGILLGPMYSAMKILSAVRLAETLKQRYPDQEFLPVFWMATEDHDVAEINHVWVEGEKLQWPTMQTGPVGRFSNTGILEEVVPAFERVAGKSPEAVRLTEIYRNAYALPTLSLATRYIVHALFGEMGVLVIDADDVRLKQVFAPVIAADIFEKHSFRAVEATRHQLEERYPSQVNGREINFFYLLDGFRDRIVEQEGTYSTVDGTYRWTETALREEIAVHPERFSPNVLLRPLYQETILPNITYIGGGAEVAYWMELKGIFDQYAMPFPSLLLRNSATVIDRVNTRRIAQLGLSSEDLFMELHSLERKITLKLAPHDLELQAEREQLKLLMQQLQNIASDLDHSLNDSAAALSKRLDDQLERFSQKLIRTGKRRSSEHIGRLLALWSHLYPAGSLQERKESINTLILRHSFRILADLHLGIDPLENSFLLVYQED